MTSGGRVGGGGTGEFRGQGAGEANPVPFGPVAIPISMFRYNIAMLLLVILYHQSNLSVIGLTL